MGRFEDNPPSEIETFLPEPVNDAMIQKSVPFLLCLLREFDFPPSKLQSVVSFLEP